MSSVHSLYMFVLKCVIFEMLREMAVKCVRLLYQMCWIVTVLWEMAANGRNWLKSVRMC